jgi:streptogramin lyase
MFRKLAVVGSICFSMGILLASSAPADEPALGEGTLSISGTVLDQSRAPLHAAVVRAEVPDGDYAKIVLTDAQGNFTIPRLRAGEYSIAASKEGYASQSVAHRLPLQGKLSFSLTSLPVIPVAQLRDADIIRYMPDDEPARTELGGGGGSGVPVTQQSEKTIVRDRCVRCHTLALVMRQGHTKEEWQALVERMARYPIGAEHPVGYTLAGSPAIKPKAIDYLSKYLGPDTKVPEELGRQVKLEYRDEVPLGSGIVYTEWKVPSGNSMAHTALPDGRGNVWFTEYGASAIGEMNLSTGRMVEFPVQKAFGNPHGIAVGADGVIWYTMSPLLGRLDPKVGKTEEFMPPAEQPVGLNVLVARDGMVWYATPGGLGRFDPKTHQFTHVVAEAGLGSPYAAFQSRTDDDVFWFCVEGQNRVGYVNVKTGDAKVLHTKLLGPKRPRIDSRGRVFFGYYEGGAIGMIDPATMKLTDFPLPYRGSAYAIHVDDHDQVWVASYERGSMIRLNPDTGALTEFPWPKPGGIVRDIFPDAQGNLWMMFGAWTHNWLVRVERPPETAGAAVKPTVTAAN